MPSDRAMAEALADAARSRDGVIAVGVMGAGHLEQRFGVPVQLEALGVQDVVVLLPWDVGRDSAQLTPDLADTVFGIPERNEPAALGPRPGVTLAQADGGLRVVDVAASSVAAAAGRPEARADRGVSRRLTAVMRLAPVVLLAVAAASLAGPAAHAGVHHVLYVSLEPDARTLRATDRIRLERPHPDAFQLSPRLAIERLEVDGRALHARRNGERVVLPLDAARTHDVVVRYAGTLEPVGDTIPAGLATGPEGTFLPSALWYPTFEAERFTYELTVDVPASQRAVAAGRLVGEEEHDGRWRATFAGDGPAEELSLFAGPWHIEERMHGQVRLRTWLHPEVAPLAAAYLEKTTWYLDLYQGWIGPYPYSAFHVASAPFPAGLGFPAMTLLGTQVLRLPFIRDTSLGHEVLHAWWGNAVSVDPREGNWAEGLTTFMADYTFVEWQGAEAAREQRLRWLRELALLPATRDQPIAAFRAKRHTAEQVVGYHKAAMVFVMLRDRIGADAFAGGIRRFAAAHRFRAATWSDLGAAFAVASGERLDEFFAQWLQRPGAPVLALHDVAAAGDAVSFTLTQQPPVWTVDVPVVVGTAGEPVVCQVRVVEASQRVTIALPAAPTALEVDPDARVLRRLSRAEVPPILRHVAFDPAATAVLAADDPDALAAAREVAAGLFEDTPPSAPADRPVPEGPLLIAGTTAAVARVLASAGLAGAPAEVAGRGTGRAWAARRPDGAPLAIVAGESADALRALARPLPHLGAQSWLVFDGARAVARGVWLPPARPLRVELAPAGAGDR